ncbi:AraC family transcriptional regulator [Variovorax sp. OV700]|jgi:AraC-like DNA-binding protein|uniref:helix-turn-helix domain-containing protein n=1 Tax=Variovorax sp. OV700 TaxID=1882826 RepID=UPI00088E4D1C|nr:AraC family transcriptional regulator [Variovorax sp. OV700]SDI82790.1 AraC-type DNA-binding protein [Variovorax sp. OV700]
MELLASHYWRDADLTGLQLTANTLLHREIRPHRHVGYTLSVSDTELHVRTGTRVTIVPPGTLLRVAPQVWHAVQARGAPWREDAMYCSGAVARCISAAHESTPLARVEDDAGVSVFLDPSEASGFMECHRLLREPTSTGNDEDSAAGRALLRQRLARWIPLRAQPTRVVDSGDERMNRLYELIASGFHQRMTLDSLADAAGLHPVHVQRRFKGAMGFTPHEMLVGHRIEYARDLIAGGARVTYAAHAAGFTDQSHLHKTFLGTYAVLPGDYRRLSALDALQPASARNGIAG